MNLMRTKMILGKEYDVLFANSGIEALEKLRHEQVDLVLLERLLPQDMTALEEYYSGQYSFYQEYFQEERRRKALALQGEYELEYEEVETPEDQLPEGIVRFLRTKKAPDGTLAHPDLPPVVPVKLPSTQSSPSSPEENREAAPSPESV